MQCRHFGECGSCGLYALPYEEQLEEKKRRLQGLLAPFYEGEIEVYPSPPSHYRMRAEFRVWHDGKEAFYAMGNAAKNGAITIEECPKVSLAIERRMWKLLEAINASPEVLKRKLFGVEFLSSVTDECLITMLYHRKLDEAWQEEARKLEAVLDAHIIGRSRKQKVVLSQEYVTETVKAENKTYRYRYYEGAFTQPNTAVNAAMIGWAKRHAVMMGGDLLEAYCGHGNFTVPLSEHFGKVLATEISKRSIAAAHENCELNGVENITFVRMASEEMTEALRGVRRFRRMEGVALETYDFKAVLVDPPRAGLDEGTRALIAATEHIIYISCNPETLARDLEALGATHDVVAAAMFDQFPHTTHIESGVVLKKR